MEKSNTQRLKDIRRKLHLQEVDFSYLPDDVFDCPEDYLIDLPENLKDRIWRKHINNTFAVSHLGEVFSCVTNKLCPITQSPYNPIAFYAQTDETILEMPKMTAEQYSAFQDRHSDSIVETIQQAGYYYPRVKSRLLQDVSSLVASHFIQNPYDKNKGLTTLDIENPYPTIYNLAYLHKKSITSLGYTPDEADLIIDWTDDWSEVDFRNKHFINTIGNE